MSRVRRARSRTVAILAASTASPASSLMARLTLSALHVLVANSLVPPRLDVARALLVELLVTALAPTSAMLVLPAPTRRRDPRPVPHVQQDASAPPQIPPCAARARLDISLLQAPQCVPPVPQVSTCQARRAQLALAAASDTTRTKPAKAHARSAKTAPTPRVLGALAAPSVLSVLS